MPKLSVLVTVYSPVAYQSLNGTDLITSAMRTANTFCKETSLPSKLYIVAEDINAARYATRNLSFEFGEIECLPSIPLALANAIKDLDFDIVAVHDAQRPLTRSTQFHRTLEGLFGCDAVRPTMAFTETLKAVNPERHLTHTIDRTKVRRVSSPEIIRREVIDFKGQPNTWSLPLIEKTRYSEVEADPESLRINNIDEVTLMEAFLHWQSKVVN